MKHELRERIKKELKWMLAASLFALLVVLIIPKYFGPALLLPGADSKDVTLYSAAWCSYCEKLRKDFRSKNIPFIEHDVEESLSSGLMFFFLNGEGVPLTIVGGTLIRGYDPERIDSKLAELGYLKTPLKVHTQNKNH